MFPEVLLEHKCLFYSIIVFPPYFKAYRAPSKEKDFMVPPRKHRKHLNLNKAFHVSNSTNRPNIAHSLVIKDLCFDIMFPQTRPLLHFKLSIARRFTRGGKIKRGREGKISLNCSFLLCFGLSQCFGAVKSSTSYPFSPQSWISAKDATSPMTPTWMNS